MRNKASPEMIVHGNNSQECSKEGENRKLKDKETLIRSHLINCMVWVRNRILGFTCPTLNAVKVSKRGTD